MIRFRSFRTRLLTVILALVGISQLAALLIVERVHERDARREIDLQLAFAADRFTNAVERQAATIAQAAEGISFDAGLREALGNEAGVSREGLKVILINLRARLDAKLVTLIGLDGRVLEESRAGEPDPAAYAKLFAAADADPSPKPRVTGYALVDGQLYSITVVSLRAPQVIAWIAVGFPIDQAFIEELAKGTDVAVTLRHGSKTLAATVASAGVGEMRTERRELPTVNSTAAELELAYSLYEKLAPARRLEHVLEGVGGGTLAVAAVLALAIARSISRPVRQLARHTRVIAGGDYDSRLNLERADELGQLAESFNAMSVGLAERDQVRDLLDKNVSPEVAAQLMRDGAALGGEEREVTVLFADLRGFTTLSERRAPREILALLNRYLDRMSGAIEQHGGVIDKFIGDEIMALFGAPVPQADAPDRAVAAALEMIAALERLNEELRAEGQAPLAVGIGINTARVVAGNIGSHRRLNYSVIGDGVNVAARLQSLTRVADYRATIIVSEATRRAAGRAFNFRSLGKVSVKGREGQVEVFAV